jgi:hypothetical protein
MDGGGASRIARRRRSEPAGVAAMQAEIMQRGPIICSMQTQDDVGAVDPPPNKNGGYWHCYEGGVYQTNQTFRGTNHVISREYDAYPIMRTD